MRCEDGLEGFIDDRDIFEAIDMCEGFEPVGHRACTL
jgi:hypothetical protein